MTTDEKLAAAVAALELAAGRLWWCATATPGCAKTEGKDLAAEWSDEARAALARIKDNGNG